MCARYLPFVLPQPYSAGRLTCTHQWVPLLWIPLGLSQRGALAEDRRKPEREVKVFIPLVHSP